MWIDWIAKYKNTFLIACLIFFSSILAACTSTEIREDVSPAPIDTNYNTLLLRVDCNGHTTHNFGVAGCAIGNLEEPKGSVRIYTPLSGSISVLSKNCGLDEKYFIKDGVNYFDLSMAELFQSKAPFCVVDFLYSWDLPDNITTEYPLRGATGKLAFRRRDKFHKPALVGTQVGVGAIQKRSFNSDVLFAPKNIVEIRSQISNGSYTYSGCGLDKPVEEMSGNKFEIDTNEFIFHDLYNPSCVIFGRIKKGTQLEEFTLLATQFKNETIKLSADVIHSVENEICYEAEDAVSIAALITSDNSEASMKTKACFKTKSGNYTIGFFSHKSRAAYFIKDENGERFLN